MSTQKFKQAPHKLLVIPGPIEVSDDVLYANAHPSMSHVSPEFIPIFGDCIRMTRTVLDTTDGQPFLISGSGTLGWDQVASNLIEPSENALVLHSGYFGDSFTDCLQTYGANVDQIKAPIGDAVSLDAVKEALSKKKYKLLTFTHVDTSTAVLSDPKAIAATVRSVSPDTLIVLDGVCSVASEEIHMDAWDIDVVLTASQKGLGTPPGLSILVASKRAMDMFHQRTEKGVRLGSYYASWKNWLPIMRAYESNQAAYFATPPVNLIYAYHASLSAITQDSELSLAKRWELHREASKKVKDAATALGLVGVAKEGGEGGGKGANGMTALYYPQGVTAGDILPRLVKRGIVVAGGLHKEIKDKYFRIGHMGITAVEKDRGDVDKVVNALKEVMEEIKAEKGL